MELEKKTNQSRKWLKKNKYKLQEWEPNLKTN
jgi:hypothetical protein